MEVFKAASRVFSGFNFLNSSIATKSISLNIFNWFESITCLWDISEDAIITISFLIDFIALAISMAITFIVLNFLVPAILIGTIFTSLS